MSVVRPGDAARVNYTITRSSWNRATLSHEVSDRNVQATGTSSFINTLVVFFLLSNRFNRFLCRTNDASRQSAFPVAGSKSVQGFVVFRVCQSAFRSMHFCDLQTLRLKIVRSIPHLRLIPGLPKLHRDWERTVLPVVVIPSFRCQCCH